MALEIQTFTPTSAGPKTGVSGAAGGATLFKALGHPLTAPAGRALSQRLANAGRVAVFDPFDQAEAFAALYGLEADEVYVQRVERVGATVLGRVALPVSALRDSTADIVLVATFDAARQRTVLGPLLPAAAAVASFDEIRIPDALLTRPADYLDPLNFATNFVLFRDADGLSTRLTGANYWSLYGAAQPRLWLRLMAADGTELATWSQDLPPAGAAFSLDSREIRARFGLAEFCGSLFLHATRIAGHEVIKYALDTYGDAPELLSCTHDANAWPADFYAGLPAPRAGEQVLLWVQNSHPVPIPSGAVGLNLMGSQDVARLNTAIPPFACQAIDVASLLPQARWPQQIEIRAGRHFVRPRYEAVNGHRLIAHANVERMDLKPNPELATLAPLLGKGYVLPLPILPQAEFATTILPTPMATTQAELPLKALVHDADGTLVAEIPLGRQQRHAIAALDIATGLPSGHGHVELVYDFSAGGEGDGWLHAIARVQDRRSGHAADTSFGAHVYNTAVVYRDEPQSYTGRPPGLTTRLFLRLNAVADDTLCHLIYPASTPWHPVSSTELVLRDGEGAIVARERIAIPCGGSSHLRMRALFGAAALDRAGPNGHVVVDDRTCRLFGFHGLIDDRGGFSLDHMFGF
ncbi:hypothetical protein [Zavarzinia sp. CC-PAN008]|uniref:hypothetical protein n=1 Tax=Zavarzinia sp. CC-PAN008 TaxID=3243332 RepID=UPI003F74985B